MISDHDEMDFARQRNGESLPVFLRRPTRADMRPVKVIEPRSLEPVFSLSWQEAIGVLAMVAMLAGCFGYFLGFKP